MPPSRRRARALGAALLGAVDGLLAVALPFAVLASIGVLAWAALGGRGDWAPFVRAAAVLQLLGHGVDVRFAAPGGAFTVTAAPLGPALITVLAAVRAGRRAARTDSPPAALGGVVGGAAIGAAALLLAGASAAAQPVAWQAVLAPTGFAAAAALLALRSVRATRPLSGSVRAGLAATALLLGASGIGLAVLLLARFADVIALTEGLGAGPLDGLVLTALQALAVPSFVVWIAAWSTGAGVALGTGSVTSAFGGQVGPLPGLPLLGIVPAQPPAWTAAALLLPVLAGFAAAALARRRGVRTGALPLGVATGAVSGVLLGVLVAASSGAAGPGRFASVGPDPLLTAVLVALETGLPAVLAAAVVRPAPPAPTPPEAAEAPH